MKYIVQDAEGKKMFIEVVSTIPQLPEGFQVLGKAEELPEAMAEIEAQAISEKEKTEAIQFLNQSDWKILRHIRQKALGIELSLSEEEYLALEQQRAEAAAKI
jgi:hypothetical protein